MREADYEAKRQRRERERAAGLAFTQTLRETLESQRIRVEDLMRPGPDEPGTTSSHATGTDDAA